MSLIHLNKMFSLWKGSSCMTKIIRVNFMPRRGVDMQSPAVTVSENFLKEIEKANPQSPGSIIRTPVNNSIVKD